LRGAHLNSDLALDLIAGRSGQLQILLNNGTGAFSASQLFLSASFDTFDVS
jgi:hypothetical protein